MNQTAKQQAKAILKDHSPFRFTFLYLLATVGLSEFVAFLMPDFYDAMMSFDPEMVLAAMNWNGGLGIFLSILLIFFGALMQYGYKQWGLRVSRGIDPPVSSLIEGFGLSGKVMLLEFLKLVYTYFWMMCGFMAMWVAFIFVAIVIPEGILPLVSELMMMLVLLYATLWVQMRYSMIYFQLSDHQDKGAWEAMKQAVSRFRLGWKKISRCFLSFWRWALVFVLITALQYALNVVIPYSQGAVESLEADVLYELLFTSQPVAYYLYFALNFLFLLKFLPVFTVALAITYEEVIEMEKQIPQGYHYQQK